MILLSVFYTKPIKPTFNRIETVLHERTYVQEELIINSDEQTIDIWFIAALFDFASYIRSFVF